MYTELKHDYCGRTNQSKTKTTGRAHELAIAVHNLQHTVPCRRPSSSAGPHRRRPPCPRPGWPSPRGAGLSGRGWGSSSRPHLRPLRRRRLGRGSERALPDLVAGEVAASAPGAAGEVAASCQGRTGGVMARRGGMGRGRRRGVAGAVLRACVRREGRVQMCGDRRNWHSTTAHGPMDAAPSPPRRFRRDFAGYLAASLTPFSHTARAAR